MTKVRGIPNLDDYLDGVVHRIRKVFPKTRRIILFGSHAYGAPTRDSDLDLFVEVPTRQRPHTRHRLIDQLLDPRPCGIDLVVKTPQELRRTLQDFNPCVEEILRKGRVLYEKTR